MKIIVELLWCIFVVALVLVIATAVASAAPVCLSKSEARKLWPRAHLYWYSVDHCWSNRRGGPPRGIRYDLIRENHAQASKADRLDATPKPTVMFPEVKQVIPWLDPKLYTPKAATLSHRLLDIDELTSKNSVDPPECCWPELNADGSLK